MTADSLINPTPADLLAWVNLNPGRVNAEDAEALRVAVAEVEAAPVALAEANAQLDEARERRMAAQARCDRAPYAARMAANPLRVPHAAAVLPDAVAAIVAEGWVDVTHAVVGVPRDGFSRGVHKPPAAGTFAALAQYAPGAKAISLRLLTIAQWGMSVGSHTLRLDDFAIVGWPRGGSGLLDPEAARAALGIPEPKAKKAPR
jgi:hypothetical protein